jgi:nucleoside 2-deoxyribosyltransferase
MSKQVYLAASCFSAAERRWNAEVSRELAIRCEGTDLSIFLPQEQVKEDWAGATIHRVLVSGLIQSDVLIANLDGPGGDDGTCWEMGFTAGMNAVAKEFLSTTRKEIFWYRTDFRRGGDCDLNVNLMMAYGGQQLPLFHGENTPVGVATAIAEVLGLA